MIPFLTEAAAPVTHPGLGEVFLSEFFGTAVLLLLGVGVCAACTFPKSKAFGAGWIVITFGWAMAVFTGVYVAWRTGAHLNPAVTIGLLASGATNYGTKTSVVDVNATTTTVYLVAELLGGIAGACVAWLAYRDHYDEDVDPAAKLGTFSTAPAIRNPMMNLVTEIIGTFVLIYWVLVSGKSPSELGPLAVSLVVLAIGLSLGGPTGYAINPARDLGPRIAHAFLPIKGKGGGDWGYAWVPVVGPLLGAVLAALVYRVF